MKNKVLLLFLAVVLVVSLVAFTACKAEEEEEVEFSLKITTIGEGTTSPKPGTSTITEGESVTVKAIPNPGYAFDRWEGDASGTDTSITFKMTSDKGVVAVFVEEVIVEEWEWPELLGVLAPPVGSLGYGTMVGWTALLQKDTGMQVRCVPVGTGMENFLNLKEGRFLWYLQASSAVAGVVEGIEGYASRDLGPFQIRSIWPSYESGTGYLVRGDSDIKTPSDIKPGTKIAYRSGSAMHKSTLMMSLVAWSGVDPDDIEWVPYTGFWGDLPLIADGTADITFSYPTSPNVYEAAAAPHGIAFIDLDWKADPEGAARFLEVWPTVGFGVNKLGVPEAVGLNTIVIITTHVTRADSDPELIYRICKWLWENYDSYQDISETLQFHDIDTVMTMVETDFVPAHEGLVRYLKELGKWTPAHEARNQQNIELITRYVEAFQTTINTAAEQQMEVDPTNEQWIELWEDYKKELNLPRFRMFIGLD